MLCLLLYQCSSVASIHHSELDLNIAQNLVPLHMDQRWVDLFIKLARESYSNDKKFTLEQ